MVYGSSSDEDEEGEHADPANQQRNRMPSIKAVIPTFSRSLASMKATNSHMAQDEESNIHAIASRNQLSESDIQQVVRFNNGIQYDIQAILYLQTTWTLDEAVRIALKAEQAIKKQGISSSMYKNKTDTNQRNSSQLGGDAQVDHTKSTHELDGEKRKTTTTTTSTYAVNKLSNNPYARPVGLKCDKASVFALFPSLGFIIEVVWLAVGPIGSSLLCWLQVMLRDDGLTSPMFACSWCRSKKTNTKKSEDSQRHNIFQTRCKINQDVFNVIIDGGSSENIISRDIVTRRKLRPMKHPKPYKIGWIKAVGEVRVTEQCEVLFAMGKYKDTNLFDIVDMDACHVLLGRPWQSDLNVPRSGIEETQFLELSQLLSLVTLSPANDRWSWSLNGNGTFSVKSAREVIDKKVLTFLVSCARIAGMELNPVIISYLNARWPWICFSFLEVGGASGFLLFLTLLRGRLGLLVSDLVGFKSSRWKPLFSPCGGIFGSSGMRLCSP
ncbi:zinc finger, CCHC-type containing protein [Tanacetum coccineum]